MLDETFNFVISRSGSDEKSQRSLALLGTWISPYGRNGRKSVLSSLYIKGIYCFIQHLASSIQYLILFIPPFFKKINNPLQMFLRVCRGKG